MNELLGWYGLPKMDKTDAGKLALSSYSASEPYPGGLDPNTIQKAALGNLHRGAYAKNHSGTKNPICDGNNGAQTDDTADGTPQKNTNTPNGIRKYDDGDDDDDNHNDEDNDVMASKTSNDPNNDDNNNNSNNGNSNSSQGSSSNGCGRRPRAIGSTASDGVKDDGVDDGKPEAEEDDVDDDDDDDDFDEDLNHVRDSVSGSSDVSASGLSSPGLMTTSVPEGDRRVLIICSWCQKQGHKMFTLDTAVGTKVFCSEICFTQCRRASFKKNKVCDWCKHVRHTVNFVDFQDGDMQLQFCSEKCLNQYKMNIFCSEARQHLQHMQILEEESSKSSKNNRIDKKSGELLITPDLWLSDHEKPDVIKQEIPDNTHREGSAIEARNCRNDGGEDDEEEDEDEDEEPGELHEREKARRALMLEQGVRAALYSGTQSKEVRSRSQTVSTSDTCEYVHTSDSKRASTHTIESDRKLRKDRDRTKRLSVEGRSKSGVDAHISALSPSSHVGKEKKETNSATITSGFLSTPNTSGANFVSASSSDPLVPHWATSQLLALMPQHLNPTANPSTFERHANLVGYSPNAFLTYSALLDSASKAAAVTAAVAGGPTADERHLSSSVQKHTRRESRRELLRDRDLSREKPERGRLRDGFERSAPAPSTIAPSPTMSHSSGGTPGPIPTPLTPLHQAGVLPGFQRQPCPFPIAIDSASGHSVLPPLFPDPNQTAMLLQLQMALQHGGGARESSSLLPPCNPPTLPSAPPLSVHPPSAPNPTNFTTPLQTHTNPSNGLPPVTVLVPYPIAVPIPVPIPIPIPISPVKLMAYFKEKSGANKPTSSATPPLMRNSCFEQSDSRSRTSSDAQSHTSARSQVISRTRRSVSPSNFQSLSSLGHMRGPTSTSAPLLDSNDPCLRLASGRDSADSIMTLRREFVRSHEREPSSSTSPFLKRSHSPPTTSYTLDCSMKKPRFVASCSSSTEDEAIDLSKMSTRSISPHGVHNSSEKENSQSIVTLHVDDHISDYCVLPQNLKVPKIHIVSERPDPPLAQPPVSVPLPLQPEHSSYSSRRSRILDAPSVPKRSHSPSPERRYVRTVPKDMVEAAKRRGLRTRVRTK